jgi:hypothetical protein
MRYATSIIFSAALGAAVVAPAQAAPIESLVDEIKRNILINNPADSALKHFSTHSIDTGFQVERRLVANFAPKQ